LCCIFSLSLSLSLKHLQQECPSILGVTLQNFIDRHLGDRENVQMNFLKKEEEFT
jgi:hypothetical protein